MFRVLGLGFRVVISLYTLNQWGILDSGLGLGSHPNDVSAERQKIHAPFSTYFALPAVSTILQNTHTSKRTAPAR